MMKLKQNTFLILLSLILFTGCAFENLSFQNSDRRFLGDGSRPDDGRKGSQVDPERDFGKHALGTKAFNQVYAGMQALTGISVPTQGATTFETIRSRYDATRASLPSSNSLNAFSPTNILAVFNLAFEFCAVLATTVDIRDSFFSGTIFAELPGDQGLGDVLGNSNIPDRYNQFVDHLLLKFFGNEVSSLEHQELMRTELLALIADLEVGLAQNLRGNIWPASVCTAALGGASLNLF